MAGCLCHEPVLPLSTVPLQIDFPESLPVSGKREEIMAALSQHQVIIVCGETGSGLEFRLLPTSGTVRISAAQDLMSDSSDNPLTVQLLADGKVVGEQAITFKQTAELSAPLTGVTVLKIVATSKTPCRTSSVALITRALIQA